MAQLLQSTAREVPDRPPRLVLSAVGELMSENRRVALVAVRQEHMVPKGNGPSPAGA
jgi:hypothetical protein